MSSSPPVAVSDEALQRAEQYVEEEEGAANKLKGALGGFIRLVAFVMAAFHLYTAYAIVPTQVLRPVHVAFVLFLSFLVFPIAKRFRHREGNEADEAAEPALQLVGRALFFLDVLLGPLQRLVADGYGWQRRHGAALS